jgi:FtsP/CotA-like multicopper oxidase with cupredoxin domain
MNLILLTVLAFLSLSCSGQTIDIPECTYPSLDPTTNTPCPAEYGYNEQWIVDLASSTPNGVNYQYMTVNGAWPPPPIVVNLGQRIRIELVNNLPTDEPITLHFHGLHQENGYTVMDGPMGVIQRYIHKEWYR